MFIHILDKWPPGLDPDSGTCTGPQQDPADHVGQRLTGLAPWMKKMWGEI